MHALCPQAQKYGVPASGSVIRSCFRSPSCSLHCACLCLCLYEKLVPGTYSVWGGRFCAFAALVFVAPGFALKHSWAASGISLAAHPISLNLIKSHCLEGCISHPILVLVPIQYGVVCSYKALISYPYCQSQGPRSTVQGPQDLGSPKLVRTDASIAASCLMRKDALALLSFSPPSASQHFELWHSSGTESLLLWALFGGQ